MFKSFASQLAHLFLTGVACGKKKKLGCISNF
jgi:hypothetical protein